MAKFTVESIVAAKCPDLPLEYLDEECAEEDLLHLSEYCFSIILFGKALKLPRQRLSDIEKDCRSTEEKRLVLVQKWKEYYAQTATYKEFIDALLSCRRRQQAISVCDFLEEKYRSENDSDINYGTTSDEEFVEGMDQEEEVGTQLHLEGSVDWKILHQQVKNNHLIADCVVRRLMRTRIDPQVDRDTSPESSDDDISCDDANRKDIWLYLAKFVSDQFKDYASDLFRLGLMLMFTKHPRYGCFKHIEHVKKQQRQVNFSALERFVLLIRSCSTVNQVYELLKSLSTSEHIHKQVVDIMHCLSTLLYSLLVAEGFRPWYYYCVYCALFHLEDPSNTSSAASLSSTLTREQRRIVDHKYRRGENVKVNAYAGTGKTFALQALARKYPNKDFLYTVFSRPAQENARNNVFKKHANVSCHTIHSLALDQCPKALQDKLTEDDEFQQKVICNLLRTELEGEERDELAGAVFKTLKNYFASNDNVISQIHRPKRLFGPFTVVDVVENAKRVWDRMISTNSRNTHVKISHDGYLKYFQVKGGVLIDRDGKKPYDFLLVDEAQDLTPVMLDILKRQNCARVFVGDTRQEIFGFRGAKDALKNIPAKKDCTFRLTRSFRFGPEIAYINSLILDEKSDPLVGGLQDSGIQGKKEGQVAFIAWKNVTLYKRVMSLMKYNRSELSGKKIYFTSARKTKRGEKPEVKDFALLLEILGHMAFSMEDLREEAKRRDLIELCESAEYGPPRIRAMIILVNRQMCEDVTKADIVFTTAHSTKGLEYDSVIIEDDFLNRSQEDRNLLYVAATRAKKQLTMSPLMLEILDQANERFFYLEQPVIHAEDRMICAKCRRVRLRGSGMRLSRKMFVLSTGVQKREAYCKACTDQLL